MTNTDILSILANYQALILKIDAHIQNVNQRFAGQIVCKKGCDDCCRHLTLFPVEALSISHAFSTLPEDIQQQVILRSKTHKTDCPLLIDHACVLYPARPIICRTHGYPIFMEKQGDISIDFCPKNFKGLSSFPKETLLSIEQLNATLFAVNQHVLASIESEDPLPERLSISQTLALFNGIQ